MKNIYPDTSPFTPSIKLNPFRSVIIQKVVKKNFIYLSVINLSKKSIFVLLIKNSFLKYTKKIIIINCNNILNLGEKLFFISEKIPRIKIKIKKNKIFIVINELEFNMIIKLREKKIYIPPDKGIFIFFSILWKLSDGLSIKKLHLKRNIFSK